MDKVISKLNTFYKAQTIRDPMAIATYVKTRYGVPKKSVYQIARGIAGKERAKQWNPAHKKGGETFKTGKHGSSKKYKPTDADPKTKEGGYRAYDDRGDSEGREYKGIPKGYRYASSKSKRGVVKRTKPRKRAGTQARMKLSIKSIVKGQSIKDTRKLAHHLAGGGARGSHGGPNPEIGWATWEGGMRGKANAREWNPIQEPDARGYYYDSSGMRQRKKEEKKKKATKAEAGRKGGKEAARKFREGTGGRQARLFKSLDILLGKAHSFGGKPLGWDDLPRDPISFATNVMQDKGYVLSNLEAGSKGAKKRNKLAQAIRSLIYEIPDIPKKLEEKGETEDKKDYKKTKKLAEQQEDSWKDGKSPKPLMTPEQVDTEFQDVKKASLSPALLRLIGFGTGLAISDTFTEAPRGEMTPSQQKEWERLIRMAMRKKKGLQKDAIDNLKSFYHDSSDTYTRRRPISNSLDISKGAKLEKDHAPIPPRQGLVWDEQKSHWTRPENVGHTVSEVQGKKRVRGSGTGIHEHTRAAGGAGGKGSGMSAVAGRRYRSSADVGVIKPHEAKHPSTSHTKITRRKLLQHLRGRAGRIRTVH